MPVTLDLKPLQRFQESIARGLGGSPTTGPVHRALKQWGEIYRGWAKERYSKFSRGGGDWAPLKESTKRRRRKGKAKSVTTKRGGKTKTASVRGGTFAILVDTGTLIAALEPTFTMNRGAIEEWIEKGIRVGYGGGAAHERGKGTIAAIARYHHSDDNPDMPARPIIVEPPSSSAVTNQMAALMENAMRDEWKRATA